MSVVSVLLKREVNSAMRSTLGWGICALFASFTGILLLLSLRQAEGTVVSLAVLYAKLLSVTIPVLVAFATMRLFPEERQTGTLETLLTAPVSDAQVVISKFAGAYFVVVFGVAASVVGFAAYCESAGPAPAYSRTGLAAALVMLAFHSAAWTAAGTLISLVSRSQTVAGIAAILVLLPHGLLTAGMFPVSGVPPFVVSLGIEQVARGVWDTRPVVLSGTILYLSLFAATRILEARRWRS